MRVNIRDEDGDDLCSLHGDLTHIIERIRTLLVDGLKLDGVTYRYLASSNSQTRNHSCYFVEDTKCEVADTIRGNVGDLSGRHCASGHYNRDDLLLTAEIRNVASYVSRMGLGFSTSNKTVRVRDYIISPDVKRNGYTFSDGVGLIASSLAKKVTQFQNE